MRWRAIIIGWAGLALCVAGGGAGVTDSIPDSEIVLSVNGEPVSAGEYRLVMGRRKAEVFSFFKERHGMDDSYGYWRETGEAISPIRRLRQLVLEELTDIKVRQLMARQMKLVQSISFEDFQAAWRLEDARRAEAVARQEVIYGPQKYSEPALYYMRLGNLDFQLKKALAADGGAIEAEAIARYYEENRPLFKEAAMGDVWTRIERILRDQRTEETIRGLCASAKVEVNQPLLLRIVPREDPEIP